MSEKYTKEKFMEDIKAQKSPFEEVKQPMTVQDVQDEAQKRKAVGEPKRLRQ